MSSSRLVRGAKTRMFAIVCLICVLGAVVFVFHGTQSKLAEVQKLVSSCNQQQESLSAQLQVIFEYKVRLEKSLTKEKEDHKQTKETIEAKLNEEKKLREKESQESKNKYDAMVQQNKFLQSQLDDLKENEKTQVQKLSEETDQLKKELESLRINNKLLIEKKEEQLEHLKTENMKGQDEIVSLNEEIKKLRNNEPLKDSSLNHLDKVNFQLQTEMDKLKRELSACEDAKLKPKPKLEPQPDTNVGDMPKVFGGQKINGSTTPGLNPDAVNNFEVSSTKPVREPEVAVVKKPDDQVAQPPKRPTQESVRPIPLPGQLESGQLDFGQIPQPGGHDPLANTLHKPNTGENQDAQLGGPPMGAGAGGQVELDAPQQRLVIAAPPDNKGDEDDNFIKQGEIPRMKNGENYHGADYEREQPEDEEDDEGEQIDYEGERNKKEQKNVLQQPVKLMPPNNHEGGVMVNPK